MKHILVIGGSYFVGRVFVEERSRDLGYHVNVVNRGTRTLHLPRVREFVCDRNDTAGLSSVLPHIYWDAVIDFCGYSPEDVTNLLAALPRGSVGHYIFISTTSVYASTQALPIREDSAKLTGPQLELGAAADYGYLKWLSEVAVAEHCTREQIPFTCLRPAIIYGKYNYAPRESYFFDLILSDHTIVIPDNQLALFQFVLVWDVAHIITMCIGTPATFGKAYNLCAEDLVSYGRLVEVLGEITGRWIPTETVSSASIDEQGIPLPFPLDSHLIYSGALIKETLGIRYTPFVDGMKKTFDWYLQALA